MSTNLGEKSDAKSNLGTRIQSTSIATCEVVWLVRRRRASSLGDHAKFYLENQLALLKTEILNVKKSFIALTGLAEFLD